MVLPGVKTTLTYSTGTDISDFVGEKPSQAAILEKLNSPLTIGEVIPVNVNYRHSMVRVRVKVSGICGSQLHELNGNKGNEKFLPHLMGHEGCGIVEAVSSNVNHVAVGDRVVMHWRPNAEPESPSPSFLYDGKIITSGKVTTLAETTLVSANRVTKIPDWIDDETAALMGCSLTTALGIVENEIDFQMGQSFVVAGGGGVGLSLIQALRWAGAGKITVLDREPKKENLLLKFGADTFITSPHKLSPCDTVIDTTGSPQVIAMAFEKTNAERYIMVGQPHPSQMLSLNGLSMFDGSGRTVKATQGGRIRPEIDIPRYADMIRYNCLNPSEIITHRYPLHEINKAFDKLRSGTAGRIMIEMEQ